MICCTNDCRQGRDCPMRLGRATRRVTHDSDGLTVTEHYCDPAWSWIDGMKPPAAWAMALAGCLLFWAVVVWLFAYFM